MVIIGTHDVGVDTEFALQAPITIGVIGDIADVQYAQRPSVAGAECEQPVACVSADHDGDKQLPPLALIFFIQWLFRHLLKQSRALKTTRHMDEQ